MLATHRGSACLAACRTSRPAAVPAFLRQQPQAARSRGLSAPASSVSASCRLQSGRGGLHVVAAQKQSFASFDDMLSRSEVPLLVDFYATWCGPCVMLSPILVKVGERLKGRVQVVKIDTDKYPVIASRFNIKALPTVVLFRDGKPIDRIEGLLTEQQIHERVSYYLDQQPQAQ